MLKPLARGMLRLLGWRIEGSLPEAKKFVAVVAPHTTAWDFGIAMVVMYALDLHISWMGAHWMFPWGTRSLMQRLGGISIDRRQAAGVVEQTVAAFERQEKLILALSPEGSRSRVVPWKTGFYRIAVAAEVPILLGSLDHQAKLIGLGPLFHPSGDYEQDFKDHIRPYYQDFEARYGERFGL